MNQAYLDTARLLTRVAPLVLHNGTFALKGGTAINLFVRGMPRLSVDLDLVLPGILESLMRQTLAMSIATLMSFRRRASNSAWISPKNSWPPYHWS
jgi:hypothetical protein